VLLALATLLKLNAVYLAAFLALRRFWRSLAGFAAGGAVLVAASVAADGPKALDRYLRVELPRIAAYGESGTPAMRLPAEDLSRMRGDAPEGFVRRDGHLYAIEGVGFAANASGARLAARALALRHPRAATGPLSLVIIAASLALAAWAIQRRPLKAGAEELAFFAVAAAAVLLAGPLTWAMNAVWLMAAGVFLASAGSPRGAWERCALAGLAAGLLLAWIPDQYAMGSFFADPPAVLDAKYVAAEALVVAALAVWLRARTSAAEG
jgi:hypothetical protein